MTVQQLIDRLRDFPPEMEVKALWDATPDFTVHRVEPFRGVALIDCGNDEEGDWPHIAEDYMPELLKRTNVAREETERVSTDSRISKPSNINTDRPPSFDGKDWYQFLWKLKNADERNGVKTALEDVAAGRVRSLDEIRAELKGRG